MTDFLYGRWPVLEALRAGRRKFEQILMADGVEDKDVIRDIVTEANRQNVELRRVPRRVIDDLSFEGNHQGVVLRTGDYPYVEVEDMLALSQTRSEKPFLLILDLLKDPQNVGVLLRVADSVGIHGVILQTRRGVSITPAVVAAASGATEHLNIAQVTNLNTTMKSLKEQEIWMVGLDIGPGLEPIDKIDLNMSLALVLGSEGEGMRRLVRDTCDMVVTLPMRGAVGSLNVATSGAISLYAAWQARGWQGWHKL
jgi:23S rRNA (guanosine2251-2'-O)-methyltransferase